MTRGRIALAASLAAALAACKSSIPARPAGFAQPSAVAVFRGLTPKNADVHPYVAVANAGRDDLTLIDAWDDAPVVAPVVVRSLAVPVSLTHPTLLVASPLWDGADVDPTQPATADLLVVAAPGSEVLELMGTWTPETRTVAAQAVDLAKVAPGADILAVVAAPVPDAAGIGRLPGRVRVVVALTGGRLAVVEYRRAGDGVAIEAGPVAIQPLLVGGAPFDAVSLAVNADDPRHLYAASPDPIGGVFGVAELDMSVGVPGAWTIAALDARAPTRLVAAASVRERLPDAAGEPPAAFLQTAANRVYAVLDPARCGPAQRIGCGIAVIDPAQRRIVPDYAGLMPYLAPIAVPGVPLALSISKPPRNPPSSDPGDQVYGGDYMRIAPPTGARATSAVAAIASSDGLVYYADLGRWELPGSASILRGSTRTSVASAAATVVQGSPRQLALWRWDPVTQTFAQALTSKDLPGAVTITPGFTTSETWMISYQGTLPGLAYHRGQTGSTADGRPWVALQVPAPSPGGGTTLTQVVRVTDPGFGLHVGDIVRINAPTIAECVDPTPAEQGGPAVAEGTVADVLPPTSTYPGGALVLAPSLTDPRLPALGFDWPACIQALARGAQGVEVEIRASAFVLVGSATGYAGRPEVQYAEPPNPQPIFQLGYENEDAITCADVAACTDATCRPPCEQLSLARKARRIYHLGDACRAFDITDECNGFWPGYDFPRANGPVVGFSLAYVPDPADGATVPVGDPKLRPLLRAGLSLVITTASGISPYSFRPPAGTAGAANYPQDATRFDRSVVDGKAGEGYRFYVPYADGFVLDFSPGEAASAARVIR